MINCRKGINLISIAATSRGNRQYPIKQTLWKNELGKEKIIKYKIQFYTVAPKNLELSVMIKPPIHTITKIITKTLPLLFKLPENEIVLI